MAEYIHVKGNITEKTGGVSKVFSKEGIEINSNGPIDYFAKSYSFGDPDKYTPKQPEDAVNIYAGIFFDGTGNNRFNSEKNYYKKIKSNTDFFKAEDIPAYFEFIKVVKNNKKEEEIKVRVADRDSYWNPYSNIAKLHDLYKEVTEIDNKKEFGGDYFILKQYVEGIGTKQNEEDDILGSAFGRSDWGIISRAEEGIKKLVADQFKNIPVDKKINKIVFDVFGFSRGAAAARHFCNEVKKAADYKIIPKDRHDQGTAKTMFVHAGGLLGKELNKNGFKPLKKTYEIEIRFLGLFDTVVGDFAVKENLGYKLAPLIRAAPLVQEFLPTIKTAVSGLGIKEVFHITAQNEWRENFALTPTHTGHTLSMLGVHSDIGGGYANLDKYNTVVDFFDVPVQDSSILDEKQKVKDFYVRHYFSKNKTEIDLINTYDHYLETTADPLIDEYFNRIEYNEAKRDANYSPPQSRVYDPTKKHTINEQKISDHYMITDKRSIHNSYSLIAMYTMLQKAIDNEVPFYENCEMAKANGAKIDYPFEYELLNDPILADYLAKMLEVIKDKEGKNYSLTPAMYQHICNKYVHLSANFGGLNAIGVKTGDHTLLGNYGFVNHPVPYTQDENGNITYKRGIYEAS